MPRVHDAVPLFVSSYPREGRARPRRRRRERRRHLARTRRGVAVLFLSRIKRFAKFFRIECPSERGNERSGARAREKERASWRCISSAARNVTRQPGRHAAFLVEVLRVHRVFLEFCCNSKRAAERNRGGSRCGILSHGCALLFARPASKECVPEKFPHSRTDIYIYILSHDVIYIYLYI